MATIYSLHHPVTGELRYIGVTSKDPAHRLKEHIRAARTGRDYRLCRWLRKLIAEDLEPFFRVVEVTEDRMRECHWIAHYRALGYDLVNCTEGGEGCSNPTDETRAKLSAKFKGRPVHENCRAALIQACSGKPLSPEHRAKISTANRGRIKSPETCAKIAAAKLGKPRPEWVRKKVGDAQRGKPKSPRTPENQSKLSAARLGKKRSLRRRNDPHTPEAIAKMKASKKGYRPCEYTFQCLVEKFKTAPPGGKITPVQVREIRKRYAKGGITYEALGKLYDLKELAISKIIRRKTWKHVV